MIRYTLYEGRNPNDNDMVTHFRSLDRAKKAFNKSVYAYALLNSYEYDRTTDDEDYRDTILEKSTAVPDGGKE